MPSPIEKLRSAQWTVTDHRHSSLSPLAGTHGSSAYGSLSPRQMMTPRKQTFSEQELDAMDAELASQNGAVIEFFEAGLLRIFESRAHRWTPRGSVIQQPANLDELDDWKVANMSAYYDYYYQLKNLGKFAQFGIGRGNDALI